MREPVICYMDGTDWEHELGHASGGNRLYPRPEEVNDHGGECGVAKVEVRFLRWVKAPSPMPKGS